jgi:hypothetical protein
MDPVILMHLSGFPGQVHRHGIDRIGTLHLNGIPFPPWTLPAELQGFKIAENQVVKKSAAFTWIVAADIEGITGFVSCIAVSLDMGDLRSDLISDLWILGHHCLLTNKND